MPSSTSNSERRQRWGIAWAIAIGFVVCAGCVVERHWRLCGYKPAVIDSMSLWASQRDRVYTRERTPLVLLGASRIQLGVDMTLLRELLPDYAPVMLAINGTYPLASLRDLAEDEDFRGVVLCDIDGRGLETNYRDMQQAYVDYYRTRWTPSWRMHRALLTTWQRHVLLANPDFGALSTLKRWLGNRGDPWKSYVRYRRDRSGDADYHGFDIEPYAKIFAEGFRQGLVKDPAHPSDQWLAGLVPVQTWVRRIRERGGLVIFYSTPTAGALREYADAAYPKAQYWDRLGAAVDAPTLDSTEVPILTSIPLPDGSHVDYRDKPAYTRALVDALVERQWLKAADAH